jgi:hypothetical protein
MDCRRQSEAATALLQEPAAVKILSRTCNKKAVSPLRSATALQK